MNLTSPAFKYNEQIPTRYTCDGENIVPNGQRAYYVCMYCVYILECADKSLYTGITNNLERRFAQHKSGDGGHYTSAKQAVRVVYTEEHPDRSSALKREAEIKRWRREKKLDLIKFGIPKVA